MTTTTSKPPPSLKNHAPSVPARLAEFLTVQIPRARSIALCMQTMGQPQVIDSWPRSGEKLKATDLAAEMWTLAIEDAGSQMLGGTPRYLVLVTAKEGDGARLGFTVPAPKTSEAGPAYTADAQGVVAQTMAHLTTRESAGQTMLVEGLEGIFAATRVQLEQAEKQRVRDVQHFEAVIESYKALLAAQGEGNKIAMASANAQIGILSAAYNAQASRSLELLPMLESLSSQKHERDLETARQARSDDRKDKLVSQAQSMVFPMLAAKLGAMLPSPGGKTPPAAPASSAPPAAAAAPSEPAPFFTPRTLRAIETFLVHLDAGDVDGIRRGLRPESVVLFDELVASLFAEADEIAARTKKGEAANTNGAGTKNGKGAAS